MISSYMPGQTNSWSLYFAVCLFSDDVRLSFGDKCAKLSVSRDNIGLSGPLKLSHDVDIRELNTGEFYKYLGSFNLRVWIVVAVSNNF